MMKRNKAGLCGRGNPRGNSCPSLLGTEGVHSTVTPHSELGQSWANWDEEVRSGPL